MSIAEFKGMPVLPLSQDERATFSNIYNVMYPAIYQYAHSLVNNHLQAEDIALETLLKIWDKRSEMTSYEYLKSFAFMAARYECFNYIRNLKRRARSHEEIFYLNKTTLDKILDYEKVNIDEIQEVRSQIELLPPQFKAVFRLLFVEQKNSMQVAELLGLTRKTVLNYKRRAIEKIRSALIEKNIISLDFD